MEAARSLRVIAAEIRQDFGPAKSYYCAKPYVDAMAQLDKITDNYYADTAYEVVQRFLCNAGTWRGEVARRVKKELTQLAGSR